MATVSQILDAISLNLVSPYLVPEADLYTGFCGIASAATTTVWTLETGTAKFETIAGDCIPVFY